MPQIAVGQGVGARFQPDDDGMKLAESSNARVVDVIVDHVGGDCEIQGCIDRVSKSNQMP